MVACAVGRNPAKVLRASSGWLGERVQEVGDMTEQRHAGGVPDIAVALAGDSDYGGSQRLVHNVHGLTVPVTLQCQARSGLRLGAHRGSAVGSASSGRGGRCKWTVAAGPARPETSRAWRPNPCG